MSVDKARKSWMRSVTDPLAMCERADWLVRFAGERGISPKALVGALARCMPKVEYPVSLAYIAEPVTELLGTYAIRTEPSTALREAIRQHVKPQLIDWNLGRDRARFRRDGDIWPDGFPLPPPVQAEPLRAVMSAALRLESALESSQRGDAWWSELSLVALQIVFLELGDARIPLYNYVERELVPEQDAPIHKRLCERLRAELER